MISLSLLKAFYAGSGCGYSFLKPKSPQEDFRGKQGRPNCLFLSAATSTQGTSFKPGGEVNWEEPQQCGFAGKSGGWGLSSSRGGWRAALALLFPLTFSRKIERKPWEERKGDVSRGTG